MRPCCVDAKKSHLTLAVFHVPENDNRDQVLTKAKEAMAQAANQWVRSTQDKQELTLTFNKIGRFGSGVNWWGISGDEKGENQRIHKLAAMVQNCLRGAGFQVDNNFEPHVTLAKVSKWKPPRNKSKSSPGKRPKRPKLTPELCAGLDEHPKVQVALGPLQLLAMQGQGEEGYYPLISTASVTDTLASAGETGRDVALDAGALQGMLDQVDRLIAGAGAGACGAAGGAAGGVCAGTGTC